MAKAFRTSVVTANDLVEGTSVFLGAEGWHADIGRAMLAFTPEEGEGLAALAARFVEDNAVVEPYLVEVALEDGRPVPHLRRERIRASHAPTVAVGAAATPSRAAERRAA
ncbi:MAG TPA: DUF2849 domain-containing protein [Thermohalobaculum sp.]|nr:DUF2849 domain-containing protein [Thermohalobaculum sp.]